MNRFDRPRIFLAIVLVVAAVCPAAVMAQKCPPTSPTPPSKTQFEVSFQGIVCFARWRDPYKTADKPVCNDSDPHLKHRAIVVEGDTMRMRHNPRLFVSPSVTKSELTHASGQPVYCNKDVCWVDLVGVDMRIRDTKVNPPIDPAFCVDQTFCDFVPQLRDNGDFHGGELRESMRGDDLPSDGAAAFFEIDGGGTLSACAFKEKGVFVDADHKLLSKQCRPFAEEVRWKGATADDAFLEMRSSATAGTWQRIHMGNTGALWLRIETVSTSRRTPEHFALHNKLLISTILPTIDVCNETLTGDLCTSAEIEVPGCSDTGWPQ
jgi:hypothetical protein